MFSGSQMNVAFALIKIPIITRIEIQLLVGDSINEKRIGIDELNLLAFSIFEPSIQHQGNASFIGKGVETSVLKSLIPLQLSSQLCCPLFTQILIRTSNTKNKQTSRLPSHHSLQHYSYFPKAPSKVSKPAHSLASHKSHRRPKPACTPSNTQHQIHSPCFVAPWASCNP